MLTTRQAHSIARALLAGWGETALAAAVWRSQMAAARGDLRRMTDWRLIADVLSRLAPVPQQAG